MIVARPLNPEAYAAYGEVVMASPHGEPGAPANQGTARRFDRLAKLENLRPGVATLNISVFRCAPWTSFPTEVALLERHAWSTQLFVPMTAKRFLVVVALGGTRPDLTTLAVFLASSGQGVSYHPGVWHHPMIALDAACDFTCLVHEDGSAGDCEVVRFAEAERPRIALA